ncbi:MAG: hypothetical protein HZA30_05440 [Candidatus Omnitrophica bacterium]|nr:hypothetical protein [Candidatus Omnitrophota bacterium]
MDAIKGSSVSTIVVTAWDSDQVYKECKKRGVTEYIPKCDSLKVICDKTIKELKKKDKYFPRT